MRFAPQNEMAVSALDCFCTVVGDGPGEHRDRTANIAIDNRPRENDPVAKETNHLHNGRAGDRHARQLTRTRRRSHGEFDKRIADREVACPRSKVPLK